MARRGVYERKPPLSLRITSLRLRLRRYFWRWGIVNEPTQRGILTPIIGVFVFERAVDYWRHELMTGFSIQFGRNPRCSYGSGDLFFLRELTRLDVERLDPFSESITRSRRTRL
jgi:hypothetical protein